MCYHSYMLTTFGLGLAIVISPCAYFLFPVVLITLFSSAYVGKNKNISKQVAIKKHIGKIALFLLGFIAGGLFLVLMSNIVGKLLVFKSIKLLLGMLFVGIGVYSYFYGIKGVQVYMPKFGVIGLGFAIPIVSSVSGCGLPFLTSAIAVMGNSGAWLLKVSGFLLGLVLPYLVVILVGDIAIKWIKGFNKKYHNINHMLTPLLFVATGIYTIFSVFYIKTGDMTQLLVLIMLVFGVICYLLCKKQANRHKSVIFLLAFSAGLAYIFWYLIVLTCKMFSQYSLHGPIEHLGFLQQYVGRSAEHSCNAGITYCPYCLTCNIIFVVASGITAYVYIVAKMLIIKKHEQKNSKK